MMLMDPDDPDGRWRRVTDRSPADIPDEVDRLASHTFVPNQIVLWQDMSGLTDPTHALDLHLLSRPAPELNALRKEQEDNFAREILPNTLTDADVLRIGRRFAWAPSAQKLLLDLANEALWDGRANSPLRSFEELLLHTNDPAIEDAAQVGLWTALALSGHGQTLRDLGGELDPTRELLWMGKKAKGAEIRATLLKGIAPPVPASPPSLQGIRKHLLHLPPVAPWPTDTPTVGFGIDLQVAGQQVIASGRNMLVSYDTTNPGIPRWAQLQRHPAEENRKTGYHPGYYRPLIEAGTLFTRWGITSLPSGLAAFDLSNGQPLWSSLNTKVTSKRKPRFRYAVPTGDPVRGDGMLFYLQWGTINDVTISRDNLFVVSDRPTADLRQQVGTPLGPNSPTASLPLTLPLRRTWTLPRSDALIALPPASSSLAGNAFVLSGGLLECLDLSPRGAIRWRRFVDAHNATLSFADENLILVERGRSKHSPNRAISLNAIDGKFLWEPPLPANLGHSYRFASNLLYHDGRGTMSAFDLQSGRRIWDRKLGEGNVLKPFWDGQQLHVFHASLWHGPHHLVLDPQSGRSKSRQKIMMTTGRGAPAHGRPVANGYYEVRFDPKPAQFVRFTTLSDVAGRGWASAAEFHVLDQTGQRIPRGEWLVEAEHERNAGPRAKPLNLIDGDRSSWWHSQWMGAIPPHPHDVFINLGARYTVSGFHYLPAKIINNNGMIRDYEFNVHEDMQDWGKPVAAGVLVNRLNVNQAEFGPKGLFFEARNYPKPHLGVFRYGFGGQAALVEDNARLQSMHGRYALLTVQDKLVLRRSDDPNYRFELTPKIEHGRHGEIVIEGDRLITARNKLVIAGLNTKQFLNIPESDKSARNKQGPVVRVGTDHFLKIVQDNKQQSLAMIDLRNGAVVDGIMENQIESFKEDRFLKPDAQRILSFDRTLLFYDNSTLSAWVAAQ